MWRHLMNHSWDKLHNFVDAVFPTLTAVFIELYYRQIDHVKYREIYKIYVPDP